MRHALLLTLALCCASAQDRPPTRAELVRDLALVVEAVGEAVAGPGRPLALRASLHNRSEARSYRVVKPGDGSGHGWREPRIWLSQRFQGLEAWPKTP